MPQVRELWQWEQYAVLEDAAVVGGQKRAATSPKIAIEGIDLLHHASARGVKFVQDGW